MCLALNTNPLSGSLSMAFLHLKDSYTFSPEQVASDCT